MNRYIRNCLLLIAIFASVVGVAPAKPQTAQAQAGTWYVSNSGNDANACNTPAAPCATIQAAVDRAASGDAVRVARGTYTATGAEVVLINKNMALSGGWDQNFTSQSGTSEVNGQSSRSGIVVYAGAVADVLRFTVSKGIAGRYPTGGVYVMNGGVLTLRNSEVRNNSSGGIGNYGTLVVIASTVSQNINSIAVGGGISNSFTGYLTLIDSTVANNLGPVDSGNAPFGNLSGGGGGIFNSGIMTVTNSIIAGNATCGVTCAGGGVYTTFPGRLSISNSAIVFNRNSFKGGGIYSLSPLYLTNSSVAHNSAEFGAGLWTRDSHLTALHNVSVAFNTAATSGGGLMYESAYPSLASSLVLSNTLVAQNSANSNPSDCAGNITSAGYNLLGVANGCVLTATVGDLVNSAPMLLPVFGPNPVIPLGSASPAIDAGDLNGCRDPLGTVLSQDQRGNTRPVDGNGDTVDRCDIGAFEFGVADQIPPQRMFLPLIQRSLSCSSGICGRITRHGQAVADAVLYLRFFNGSMWSTQSVATSAPDGSFVFTGIPSLTPGQRYYVLFLNANYGDLLWATRQLSNYITGSPVEIGDFDIAYVRMVEPYYTNVTLSLPYTFWWQTRPATPSDSYEFNLYDETDGTPYFYTPQLGNQSKYALTSLPSGFATNIFYAAEVWVYSPDGGFGISTTSTVKFGNNQLSNPSDWIASQHDQLPYDDGWLVYTDLRRSDPMLRSHYLGVQSGQPRKP
jgi:hypothetical protein